MIKTYKSLEKALKSILPEDKEYLIVRHDIPSSEIIGEHFHPDVDEWMIFTRGKINVWLDLDKYLFDTNKSVHVIKFPKDCIHGVRCNLALSYFVVREGFDKIIYLDDLLKKKNVVEPKEDPCGKIWELYNYKNLSVAYVEVTGTAKRHKHELMQEKYRVEKGSGEIVIADEVLKIKEGDVVSIPKGRWHYLKKLDDHLEVLVITHPAYNPEDFITDD